MSETKVLTELAYGIPLKPLPEPRPRDNSVPHAPCRTPGLTEDEFRLAVQNALRYFPTETHEVLAPEFAKELQDLGHIYMHRFRPKHPMYARPIDKYPAKCTACKAVMLMIQNNLNPEVAQFPHELVTYGGNGCVFSNWAQYWLVMYYLSKMTDHQTLVLHSGHPLGLFPSFPISPRVVLTNGMTVFNYSKPSDYDRMYAMGNSQYGQMTAGSYAYIGPQGIVHGTTLTLKNAGRKYLHVNDMRGKVFVTSGLGGMSGAQGKASVISDTIGVIAEVSKEALMKRFKQGWIDEVFEDIPQLIARVKELKAKPIEEQGGTAIGYLGNVVDLWEAFAQEEEKLVDLGSDQTSLHIPFGGGYYPVGLGYEESIKVMEKDPTKFKSLVEASLVRHASAINTLADRGMRFWDYGNCFLLQAKRAGADVEGENGAEFRYPSYVQDIMGDIFSLGFGPFRWVCTSGKTEDLEMTDKIAAEVFVELMKEAPQRAVQCYQDNLLWIQRAGANKLVVGSQARILYSDSEGRITLAQRFNEAVTEGRISAPVVLSRDHHDVGGTDSPYRETSNITDGSRFCADMAVHNFVGDAMRGASWISLHNGGGTGWGEAVNGGFGLVLDGRKEMNDIAKSMLFWDVNQGIARRAWSRNENAEATIARTMEASEGLEVTMPSTTSKEVLDRAMKAVQ